MSALKYSRAACSLAAYCGVSLLEFWNLVGSVFASRYAFVGASPMRANILFSGPFTDIQWIGVCKWGYLKMVGVAQGISIYFPSWWYQCTAGSANRLVTPSIAGPCLLYFQLPCLRLGGVPRDVRVFRISGLRIASSPHRVRHYDFWFGMHLSSIVRTSSSRGSVASRRTRAARWNTARGPGAPGCLTRISLERCRNLPSASRS